MYERMIRHVMGDEKVIFFNQILHLKTPNTILNVFMLYIVNLITLIDFFPAKIHSQT